MKAPRKYRYPLAGTRRAPVDVDSLLNTIPAGQFKARCLELMEEVRERHVEYVITKHGKPVAKLVSCDETPPDAFGFLGGTVLEYGDIVSPDPDAWSEKA
jgi:prevent-host-death family protein